MISRTKRSWVAILVGFMFFIAGIGFLISMVIPVVYDACLLRRFILKLEEKTGC